MKLAYQPEAESNTIAAGEFKAKCLRLMDDALTHQRALTVTKRGKVIGQFVPVPTEEKPFRSIFGRSPQINVPSHEEWTRWKAELAKEWRDPEEKFADLLKAPKRKKKRKKL